MTTTIRKYLRFPAPMPVPEARKMVLYLVQGALLFPFYWLAAFVRGCPGMGCRWRCLMLGLRLLANGDVRNAYRCIVWPLDSVRYFEFEVFWEVISRTSPASILDISSPRLFLAMALAGRPALVIDGINPDEKDLRRSIELLAALGFSGRCKLSSRGIEDVETGGRQFDLVTCMSVLEHIVDDLGAVHVMWSRVAPGGHLVLSMPCATRGVDEYTNVDEYGLLEPDADGFVFWQRYYDQDRLQELFAVTGPPANMSIFGERVEGNYDADVARKRSDPRFPRWREPYDTSRAFVRFDALSSLPGMGVIALEFRKPHNDDAVQDDTR